MTIDPVKHLNETVSKVMKNLKPPEQLTVSQWAEKNRTLSREASAEPGLWKNERTPYLVEIMDAFSDVRVRRITFASASQVGKSEVELNIIAYIIAQDPGSILYIQPTIEDAKKFSRLRVASMIRDTKAIRDKVADVKTRDGGNTILQKSFPGGMLTITGSNSASSLASTPARYVIGDERDRWALSAGTEGDPWALAEARQATFYNAKAIEVSTPTIKGASNIEDAFLLGTQERWCHQCPHCEEYHNIIFNNIRYKEEIRIVNHKKTFWVREITYVCPECGCVSTEAEMRKQPAKWIPENPDAYQKGHRSFWLNAFSSPWTPWSKIILKYLEALGDNEKLKVVYNTLFGELWEDRGELPEEDALMERREDYGTREDGTPVELPNGVLLLTCGVDTQDDRLEYEVVGHGLFGENWGIKKGVILGVPDTEEVWEQLDQVIDHVYRYKDRKGLRLSITLVDSGGHYTHNVYAACQARLNRRVFAIKGGNTKNLPYTQPPKKVKIVLKGIYLGTCWLYYLGVDAGKAKIMDAIKTERIGAKYCHFPEREECGYHLEFFHQLLSEKLELVKTKKGVSWEWVMLPGHRRNEALDCRNYAMAGLSILGVDMKELEGKRKEPAKQEKKSEIKPKPKRTKKGGNLYNDW